MGMEDAQARCNQMEKKAKNFDKIVVEWKNKIDSLQAELDQSQVECRSYSTELFKVKTAYDETMLMLENVRKENKNLSNEIKDIMDQIGEGGRTIHEIDKIRKRLEAEKLEFQAALEEAEGALEQEENKVLRAQLELTQKKQEIERRVSEKEEEIMSTKKNFQKGLDGMQQALESETKGKAEAERMMRKLEADVSELETALEHANAANGDTQKAIKKYPQQIRDSQTKMEDEQRNKEVVREQCLSAERRANITKNSLEESRTLLEQADRARRLTEQMLSDTNAQLSELTCNNQSIAGAKVKIESEMQTLHGDLDQTSVAAHLTQEKSTKSMVDAARLADELRCEQSVAMTFEKEKKLMESTLKDLQNRLDDAETNALKSGKKAMNKMDSRIRELESDIDAENRRLADATKNLRKSERRLKELSYVQDEDRKNHERMQKMIDSLQTKVKTYKKQIEEAEEIASLNLCKFRQVQGLLADVEERADLNEKALAKARVFGRSTPLL